jgi:uncharacterized ferritin-like protein (DUF455 family)
MLRRQALAALLIDTIPAKVAAVEALDPNAPVDTAAVLCPQGIIPGREARPVLVPPSEVPRRSLHTVEGRAALLHAIAHIEFNAIDLALDIVWRFPDLPEDFYRDWLRIAQEEAYHFTLVNDHLRTLGFTYGDFPAHRGLWDMAEKTADDVLARLALVPRAMEARGLDVNRGIHDKLVQAGETAAGPILDIILRDEIGHVAAGNRWYRHVCQQRGLEPLAAEAELAARYGAPRQRGPFNLEARQAAGFNATELAALAAR